MSSAIHGISWVPKWKDNFITWGNEVCLYQLQPQGEKVDPSSDLNQKFIASETRMDKFIRCLKASFNEEILVAIGLASGKISLLDFDPNKDIVEFAPRQQRSCICLAWNEYDKNVLAAGHDRNRSDFCITVFDTDRGMSKDFSNLIGLSEVAHSMCWDINNPKVLIAGMNQKEIKFFDMRQSNTSFAYLNTRMVHGLAVSPSGHYIASYGDSFIGLWDLRNLEQQLPQIQTSKSITNLSWNTSRANILCTTHRECSFMQLTDIHSTELDGCSDVYYIKRKISPQSTKAFNSSKVVITDISWSLHYSERALILLESGDIIDYTVPLRNVNSWDSINNLFTSVGFQNVLSLDPTKKNAQKYPKDDISSEDIALLMYKRAINDYGILSDIKKNGEIAQNNDLKLFWNNLAYIIRDNRMLGIKTILGMNNSFETQGFCSEAHLISWPEPAISTYSLISYKNEHRDFAQVLFGWDVNNDVNNETIVELCKRKEHTRAAMICIFHLKVKQAVEILSRAADQENDPSILRIAAITLSAFSAERCNSILRNQRGNGYSQIADPYLRAIFAFLTGDSDSFESVLTEHEIPLSDRLAFACRYLNDTNLQNYIKNTVQACIDTGNLNGLLLTGASNEGVNLLQCYIDRTGDVQTASLLAIRFFQYELFAEYRVQYWITSYLDLLDAWSLWEKRAELEIKMENIRNLTKPIKSVFLLCNFCGKSVSAAFQEEIRIRNTTSNINKLSSCPNCRKPLPRCSLCLLHMGTLTGINVNNFGWQSKPFSKWFSWCQTCRHGGHTEHLNQWFSQNTECPVTTCFCKCFSLDLINRKLNDI